MKCTHNIPKQRLALGYTTCVECSTEEKLGCIDTINHKTGNTIQVMSRSDADQASKLTKRAGFGTLRAITKGSFTNLMETFNIEETNTKNYKEYTIWRVL